MSVTSRISFNRSNAFQPASNLYGPMAAAAVGGSGGPPADQVGPSPSILGAVQGNPNSGLGGVSFIQVMLGLALLVGIWWLITIILERLLPLKDTPQFFRDWVHGFRMALIVAFWFILWKMSSGVWPLKNVEPYATIAQAL